MRAFELAVARRHQAVHESYQDAFSVSCASSALHKVVSEAESEPDLLVSYRTLAARGAGLEKSRCWVASMLSTSQYNALTAYDR